MSDELFTEHRVKITKCFRVSDRLVPTGLYRLCSDVCIRELRRGNSQNPDIINDILSRVFRVQKADLFKWCLAMQKVTLCADSFIRCVSKISAFTSVQLR